MSIHNNQIKKFALFKKKGISQYSLNDNKKKSEFKINDDKNIFSKTSIQFNKKANPKKDEKIKPNINIISLNKKNLDKLRNIASHSKTMDKKVNKKKEKDLDKINERMYYKAINYEFGYKQIKDFYKITEVAALNFAKKKKIDKMKLDLLK